MLAFQVRSLRALLASLLLFLPTPTIAAIAGTSNITITANSSAFTYSPPATWGNKIDDAGLYETWSNASNAQAVFTFTGVAIQYLAQKSYDRGRFNLTLDSNQSWTLDLYQSFTGVAGQLEELIWSSPLLSLGVHTVRMFEIGNDSRVGWTPALFLSTWSVTVPTDSVSSAPTEGLSTASSIATTTPVSSSSDPLNSSTTTTASPASSSTIAASPKSKSVAGAAAGGAIGGLAVVALIGALIYYCRRGKVTGRMALPYPDRRNSTYSATTGEYHSSQVYPEVYSDKSRSPPISNRNLGPSMQSTQMDPLSVHSEAAQSVMSDSGSAYESYPQGWSPTSLDPVGSFAPRR